jgi:peptide/nickel transport system permease protein
MDVKMEPEYRRRQRRLGVLVKRHPGMIIGLVVLMLFALIAIVGPLVAPHDPLEIIPRASKQAPSALYLFGTDNLGRDVLSRVIYGTRISIVVGLIAVAIAMVGGTFLGTISGYYGGWTDSVIMRTMDIMLAFPGILLAIAIVAILGPSLANTMIAVGLATVPVYARTARGSILSVKTNDYVEAARCIGVPDWRLMLRHVLPNITAPLIVLSTVNVGTAILSAAGLSYLGLGAQPPTPEWGAMLAESRVYLREGWWMATFPGIAIMLVVLAVNLLGDGLRDELDPRLRNQ